MQLYPLKFEPVYLEKVWGGRSLTRLGRKLPGGAELPIGEAWELADLAATSGSGAGGGAVRSVVAEGPLAGKTLHDVIDEFGELLLGSVALGEDGNFPLLIKYLDAHENLSVQVHPSQRYAEQHPEAHLKSEAWYVIDAEPGAAIYKGVHEGVTPEQFRSAIESGDVEPLMIRVPVQPGDCHYLPSGTCHALGAGIVVAEVQTPSDTTFRVYDWGRQGRELHVDQALACIQFSPVRAEQYEPATVIHRDGITVESLVRCEHFRIEKIQLPAGTQFPIVTNHQMRIWMMLAGKGQIACSGDAPTVRIERGQTLLIPAELDEPVAELNTDASWLEMTIPSAMDELIA